MRRSIQSIAVMCGSLVAGICACVRIGHMKRIYTHYDIPNTGEFETKIIDFHWPTDDDDWAISQKVMAEALQYFKEVEGSAILTDAS